MTPGWAVDTGDWIVSRLPDSDTITARSADGETALRYVVSSDFVKLAFDGGVVLLQPDRNTPDVEEPLLSVSPEMIEASRSSEGDLNARVFFSEDGQNWRSVWQSSDDSWFATLAVGDDEVLLTGAQLTGVPVSISINE